MNMSLKNYLTTFELTSEREQKLCRNIADGLLGMYDSTKQLYHRTPAIVRAGALVGLGVLGTLAYQGHRERVEANKKVWVDYYHGGTEDSKDRPYEFMGFVAKRAYESIRENKHIYINFVDLERNE